MSPGTPARRCRSRRARRRCSAGVCGHGALPGDGSSGDDHRVALCAVGEVPGCNLRAHKRLRANAIRVKDLRSGCRRVGRSASGNSYVRAGKSVCPPRIESADTKQGRPKMAGGANSTKAVIYALVANGAIAVSKYAAAVITGSGSMLAEAVHSTADCGNQALLLLGLKRAKRPPSDDYPMGYGKEIYFWSFIVAIMLFSVGGLFSLYEGGKAACNRAALLSAPRARRLASASSPSRSRLGLPARGEQDPRQPVALEWFAAAQCRAGCHPGRGPGRALGSPSHYSPCSPLGHRETHVGCMGGLAIACCDRRCGAGGRRGEGVWWGRGEAPVRDE